MAQKSGSIRHGHRHRLWPTGRRPRQLAPDDRRHQGESRHVRHVGRREAIRADRHIVQRRPAKGEFSVFISHLF